VEIIGDLDAGGFLRSTTNEIATEVDRLMD
jgi:hypothetical protein